MSLVNSTPRFTYSNNVWAIMFLDCEKTNFTPIFYSFHLVILQKSNIRKSAKFYSILYRFHFLHKNNLMLFSNKKKKKRFQSEDLPRFERFWRFVKVSFAPKLTQFSILTRPVNTVLTCKISTSYYISWTWNLLEQTFETRSSKKIWKLSLWRHSKPNLKNLILSFKI